LLRELQKLRDAQVTAEELERAQTFAIGAHQIRQQSGGAVLGELVEAWMFGTLAELEQYEAQVRGVTPQRILETARQYFELDRRVEGIVRGTGKSV
jgi:zinc protease